MVSFRPTNFGHQKTDPKQKGFDAKCWANSNNIYLKWAMLPQKPWLHHAKHLGLCLKKWALASRGNHSGGCFSSVVGRRCPGCARSLGSIHGGVRVRQGERFDFWEGKFLLYSVWAFQSGNKWCQPGTTRNPTVQMEELFGCMWKRETYKAFAQRHSLTTF